MSTSPQASPGSIARKVRGQFVTGLIVLAPVGATVLILVWIFTSVDGILQPVLRPIFGETVPGVGFGITVVLVYLTGVAATSIVGRGLIRYGESLLARVPLVRPLYASIKQIIDSFSDSGNAVFKQTVLVEFPRKGMRTLAFVTGETVTRSGKKLLTIYVPTSPNPTSGFFQIVSDDDVIPTGIPVSEAMKMVISAGRLSSPEFAEGWPAGS